ncbi:uncharacterized protein METZ01_LOCUS379790, partial [marine metagenome]
YCNQPSHYFFIGKKLYHDKSIDSKFFEVFRL